MSEVFTPVKVPENYDPLKDSGPYMNPVQLSFFYQKLKAMEAEELADIESLYAKIQEIDVVHGDDGDRNFGESAKISTSRAINRDKKYLQNIAKSISKIESGDYGFSEKSGDEIGLKRLLSKPTARLTIDEQEQQDMQEEIDKRDELDQSEE